MGWQDHAPAAGGAGDGSRSWRQPTSGQPAPEPRRTSVVTKARGKQFFASSLAVGCAVVLIWLLMLFIKGCDNAELFVAATLKYEEDKAGAIPPNWMGDADRKMFQSLEKSKLKVTSFANDLEFQKSLKDLFAGKNLARKKDTACVIYLSGHAMAEPLLDDSSKSAKSVAEADVLLLTKSDGLVSKANRLRLSQVLTALGHLPKEQRKLLLLDLGRLQGAWRLGVFDNFVIEAIEAAVQREKIPNLFVITACSSGETSWVSPHLGESGQSVFAHFVARGLAGEADQTNGKSDGSITVSELFRFVHTRVNDWVERNRDPAGQHPRLFAGDVDVEQQVVKAKSDTTFSVILASPRKSTESKGTGRSKESPIVSIDKSNNELFGLWKRRQALEQPTRPANVIYSLDPIGFRALTHRLMRAEEFLLHHDIADAAKELKEAEQLCQKLESHAKQGHFAAANFQAEESFLRRLTDRFGLGAAPSTGGPAVPPPSPPDVTLLALPDDHLAMVLSRAHKKHSMPTVMKETESVAVQKTLVELRQLAESVAFGHHTVLPWLRQGLKDADQLRRKAEDSFFVVETVAARQKRDKPKKGETAATADQSADKVQEVRQLAAEATQSFERVRDRATTLENAQLALNRARATLPEWLAFASDRSTNDELRETRLEIMNQYHEPLEIRKNEAPKANILASVGLKAKNNRSSLSQLDREILSAALEAIELRQLLRPQFDSIEPDQLQALKLSTKNLVGSFEKIQQRFQEEADHLRNTSQPQPSHWRLFRDVLRCSTLEPETRRDLFGKLIHLRLTEDTSHNTTIKTPEPNDHQTANWQMLCTIHALSLVPPPTSLARDKLWNAWHDVSIKDSRVEPESVIKLSRNLRDHWVGHLDEASAECRASQLDTRTSARNCLEQKDLSARILFTSDAINLENEPTRQFEKFLIAEMLLDSSERYLDDFWDQWYADAAKTCFDKAVRVYPKLLDEDRNRLDTLLETRRKSELLLEAASVEFGTHPTATGSVRLTSDTNLPRGLAATWLSYKVGDPRASKNRPLADRCFPHSVGLEIAHRAASNEVSRFEIAQPDTQAQTTSGGCKPSQIVPRVFFRDHSWSTTKQGEATFNPCRPEGTLIRHLATTSTGAIRVTGKDRKSVVFVLDASGSMQEKDQLGKVIPDRDRWTRAKEILLGSLREMEANNRSDKTESHQVELIVYGHRDSNDPGNIAFVKTEVPMSPLTVNLIADVGKKLESIEPFDSTPLLTAAKQACNSLSDAMIPGTVIVITDGVPNDGATRDPVTKIFSTKDCRPVLELRKREIKQVLKKSRELHREIELQVIGLGLSAQQQPALTNEEAAIVELKSFIEEANGRDGKFYSARTFDDLKGALNITTGARHFFVSDLEQPSSKPKDGPLNEPLELKAGTYQVAFGEPDRLKDGLTVKLCGDELLELELLPDGELKHIHPQKLNTPVAFRETKDNRRFEFGDLESFHSERGRAEFHIGIQDRTSGSNRRAPYTERPERLIVEVSPNREKLSKVRPMTYRIKPGKSDPTWTIQVDELPQQVSDAEVQAYANWDPVPPDAMLEASTSPQSVSVPIDKTQNIEFQMEIETPANDRVDLEDSVQVKLRLSNPTDAESLEKEWRHLAYLHVQLRLDGKPIPHLDETAEVIASANEIRWRFRNLPKDSFSAQRLRIAVTSWHRFQLHALPLEKPLLIKAE